MRIAKLSKSINKALSLLLFALFFQNCSEMKFEKKTVMSSKAEDITIGSTLKDKTVLVGDLVEYTVSVVGSSAAVDYDWLKDGATISGQRTSTFRIEHAQLSDSGLYEAMIILNGEFKEKKSGNLKVLVCNPGQKRSCNLTNGTGNETCAANGLSWGSCQVAACSDGYVLRDGLCVPKKCDSTNAAIAGSFWIPDPYDIVTPKKGYYSKTISLPELSDGQAESVYWVKVASISTLELSANVLVGFTLSCDKGLLEISDEMGKVSGEYKSEYSLSCTGTAEKRECTGKNHPKVSFELK